MKKIVNIFLAVLITLFSFPIGGGTVSANDTKLNPEKLEAGIYEVTASFYKDGENEISTMDEHKVNPSKLIVDKSGNIFVEMLFNNASMIKSLKIDSKEAEVIHSDEKENQKTYAFAVKSLVDKVKGSVYVEVPGLYAKDHKIDLGFNVESLKLVESHVEEPVDGDVEQPEETEKPEEEKPTEPGEGSNEGETEKPEEETDKEESDEEEALSLDNLPNGYYAVDVSHLHDKEEKPSSMARYLGDAAFLYVNNDEVEITLTVNDNATVTKVQVANENPIVRKVEDAKSYETFKLDKLSKFNNAYAEYQAPYQGSIHYGKATFRIMLDEETLKSVSKEDAPGYGLDPVIDEEENQQEEVEDPAEETEDPAEEPTEEPEENDLVKHSIDYVIKHATKDETSAANSFFEKPGTLIERDGKTFLQTRVTSWSMVKDLTYAGKKAKVISENKKNDTALVEFEIKDGLSKAINLKMTVEVPGLYKQDHEARLVMDADSKKLIEDSKQEPKDETGIKPDKDKTKGQATTDDKKTKKDKNNQVKADKVSKIDYVVYQADKDEVSAADSFFQKPAILLEKDGKTYLQFTVTSWSMVNWLKANGKNVLIIDEDKAKDTATVQIEINGALSEAIALEMKITVPGLYEMEHDARLVLDPSSIVELDGEEAEKYLIHTDVAKPGDFGSNDNGNENGDKKFGKNGNPQTGDTSQIFFFASLLMASLAVLVIQLRRRLTA